MNEHPIEGLMNTTMENLKDMIDVNTVIGETIELENGTAIIPVSKVCLDLLLVEANLALAL